MVGAKRSSVALLAATAVVVAGCATLRVDLLRSSATRPGHVAAYFTIERIATRAAVGGLPVERFSVYEDGTAVPPLEARSMLLDPAAVAAHYTIVLVDAGGAAVRAGLLPSIAEGVRSFVERSGDRQRIAVYAFDGETTPRLVAARATAAEVSPQIQALATLEPRDTSTNLHGAIVWGIQQLDRDLAAATQPLKFGTVVVFTATRDIANRMTVASVDDALLATPHDVYAAGVGRDIDARTLTRIGRTQSFYDANPGAVRALFDRVADRVAARAARHYFFSYCTPLRADRHRVRIEAREEGGGFGSAEFDVDATGFRAGCDSARVPAWGQREASPAVAPDAGASAGESDGGAVDPDASAPSGQVGAAP
ncbi:MAG: VWA domain-containing protein [Myxococcales bacterium]|nr:VWA domain-containing protein [Myxococcales bacterium]